MGTSHLQTAVNLATHYQRSIIPVDETKKTPLLGFLNKKGLPARLAWKPFQSKRASTELINQWDKQFAPMAYAMVTGAISGIITLDFDGEEGKKTLERLGLKPHRITGSGGYQVDCPHPGWPVKTVNSKTSAKQPWTQAYPGLDIRGDGGIALVAGRNTKGEYVWVRDPGDLESLESLPTDLREMLGLLHAPKEKPAKEPKIKIDNVKHDFPQGPRTSIADVALEKYLSEAQTMGRDNACFLLAVQLHANNYSQMEAESICRDFSRRVHTTDQHGNVDPFTEEMAREKVVSAWSYSPLEPWEDKRQRRQERTIPHIVPRISHEEHQEKLTMAQSDIQNRGRAHIQNADGSDLIFNFPPGAGKSNAMAKLGITHDIAWAAQRKDMVSSVDTLLHHFNHIHPCTEENCPHHGLHNELGRKGYVAWTVHEEEKERDEDNKFCEYASQFFQEGSTVFQLAHLRSSWPAMHEAIVIDEVNPSDWLPERVIDIEKLHAALTEHLPNSTEDIFLRLLQGLITDTAQLKMALYGKEVFDALDTATKGRLVHTLGILDQKYGARPYEPVDIDNPDEEERVRHFPHVVMPHIVKAFMAEIVKWQKGQEWNSCIRIEPDGLHITERLQITPNKDGGIPPTIILDATADEEIFSRLFDRPLTMHRVDIPPAPGTKHIAVRTGKRYGKTSLTTERKDGSPNKDLERTIAECRYTLAKLDPTGEQMRSGKVGIISFQDCVDSIADALGISLAARGHYWGIRGSNHLEDCETLLLIGTPALRPDELMRQARAIYRDDPEPLVPTSQEDWKNERKHTDPRVQHVAEYTTNAELTQAAHRNRPLRHANRTVVSFCEGDIDFLPITETIIELPYLTTDGEDRYEARRKEERERLEKAYAELTKDGKVPTQAALAKAAKVRKTTAAYWMKEMKSEDEDSQKFPSSYEDISYRETGTKDTPESPPGMKHVDFYQGLCEGVCVTTPKGQGIVCGLYHCQILKRVRVAVQIRTWDGIRMYPFDVHECVAS